MITLPARLTSVTLTILLACLTFPQWAPAREAYPGDDFASGEELCAVRSKLYGTGSLAQGYEYDVTEESCIEFDRMVIIGYHVEKNAGHLNREDQGVTRFKREGRNQFCHYYINPEADEIPEAARRWLNTPKAGAENPKKSPDYAVLRDYASRTIVLECQDTPS